MKAIVLCGGLGTRLGALTANTPKPMLEVAGRPFVAHVLNKLCIDSIDEIILAGGFAWKVLYDFVGNKWNDRPVHYSIESKALGTGGAIALAMKTFQLEEALIVNGDTLFDIDLAKFTIEFNNDVATRVALRQIDDCSRYGRVSLDNDCYINSFGEKGHSGPGLINGGIYLQHFDPLKAFADNAFSFETDYLAVMHKNLSMEGMSFDGYFIDIGIPSDLSRAQVELNSKL